MTDFTDYIEALIRDWMSQGSDMPTAPGTIYVAAHAGAPGDDAASNEVSGNNYSRVSTTAGTDWDTPANGQFENANEVRFPEASGSWGTITHVSLWDASGGGNSIGTAELDTAVEVSAGQELAFSTGSLTFTAD